MSLRNYSQGSIQTEGITGDKKVNKLWIDIAQQKNKVHGRRIL